MRIAESPADTQINEQMRDDERVGTLTTGKSADLTGFISLSNPGHLGDSALHELVGESEGQPTLEDTDTLLNESEN